MALPDTEIATIPVKPGLDLTSDGSEAKEALDAVVAAIRKAKGCQRVIWGRQIENPDVLDFAMDWTSNEDAKTFSRSADFAPVIEKSKVLAVGPQHIKHVKFTTTLKDLPLNTVIEMMTLFYPLDIDEKAAEEDVDKFLATLTQYPNKIRVIASGWVIGEVEHPDVEGKSKAFMGAFARESLQGHIKDIQPSTEIQQALGTFQVKVKHIEIHHTSFQE